MTDQVHRRGGPADKAAAAAASEEVDEARARKRRARRARRLAARKADSMPVVAATGPRQVRVVDAELREPAPKGGLREVFSQPYLLRLIVRRELAQMYSASLLGLLWSYVQPAMRFAVYYVVMGFILRLHRDFPHFAIHLFTGMVVVHYFSETWNGGTRSIWQNRALVKKMRLPREVFPVASMVVAGYHTLPQMLVLVLACLVAGWHVTWTSVAALLLGLAILTSFAGALALFFSALNVFYRDFQNIVGTILQFMHFMVPMIYPFERIYAAHASHPVLYQIYVANPVAQAVMLFQRFFWYPVVEDKGRVEQAFPPDQWVRGLITLGICLVLLYLAQRFFTRAEGKFPERL
ncbi:ABC-2 type transport system permease protein [Nocardioides scoriae]|uniref:ABC-2 type transport system permease protein n=1 Tax=Nocardioides scoriae TaxID=642780 RepID=A0A1H1QX84_9ACTN|nr:ABC transporter permease [Nocardioides scoriae]SDS28128.1 ABC-2 type transport system permease protein [Nocardioides scoriae]